MGNRDDDRDADRLRMLDRVGHGHVSVVPQVEAHDDARIPRRKRRRRRQATHSAAVATRNDGDDHQRIRFRYASHFQITYIIRARLLIRSRVY